MNLRPYQQIAIKECWDALKADDKPVLLMASVGAGKSIMLASILIKMQSAGKRALCLVNNAELVRNNCQTFNKLGGDSSIYCAALGCKDTNASIIFGTPQSVLNGINKNEDIGKIKFNLIVVDEAHAINYINHRSCFMRILRHYKSEYEGMRLLGATGTNFRFRGSAIVGDDCLFKSQVGNITTEQLIDDKYLIEPHFEIDDSLKLDFSGVKVKRNGLFDQKELESVVEKSARLTELICSQVVHIMETQNRRGVFLFATTKKHAYEILSHLPVNESAIILGETSQDERTIILDKARNGSIRYLVNIAIISVGVDIPAYDTIAYLRPTESLVLLVQTMGRVLRLSPNTQKSDALVLDFAGNIDRHRDWDNPILQMAVKQTIDKDKPLCIQCPACLIFNTEFARRCVGTIHDKRCDYYFEFKECPNIECKVQNDISARHCRVCDTEIIDPNEKLNLDIIKPENFLVLVDKASYKLSGSNGKFMINCTYHCARNPEQAGDPKECEVYEYYKTSSDKSCNIFYANFVKKHVENPSSFYKHLNDLNQLQLMLKEIKTPQWLRVSEDFNLSFKDVKRRKIIKKYFDDPKCKLFDEYYYLDDPIVKKHEDDHLEWQKQYFKEKFNKENHNAT